MEPKLETWNFSKIRVDSLKGPALDWRWFGWRYRPVVCCHIPWAQCRCPWRRAGPPWRACDWGAAGRRTPRGDARLGWSGCCPTRHCRRPTVPRLQPPSPAGCLSFSRTDTASIQSSQLLCISCSWQDKTCLNVEGFWKGKNGLFFPPDYDSVNLLGFRPKLSSIWVHTDLWKQAVLRAKHIWPLLWN